MSMIVNASGTFALPTMAVQKRAHEYRAVRERRLLRRNTSAAVPLRAPPE